MVSYLICNIRCARICDRICLSVCSFVRLSGFNIYLHIYGIFCVGLGRSSPAPSSRKHTYKLSLYDKCRADGIHQITYYYTGHILCPVIDSALRFSMTVCVCMCVWWAIMQLNNIYYIYLIQPHIELYDYILSSLLLVLS